jgi:hypothetical protein
MPAATPTASVQYQTAAHNFRVIIRVGEGRARRQVFSTVVGNDAEVVETLIRWHVAGADAAVLTAAA